MNELLKELLKIEDPNAMVVLVKAIIDKYKSAGYSLLEEVHNIYKDYANNKEYPATLARIKRNLFDAYIEVGFSEDQAMAFIIHDNIQLLNSMKQSAARTKK